MVIPGSRSVRNSLAVGLVLVVLTMATATVVRGDSPHQVSTDSVVGLIDAIEAANADGAPETVINLEAGIYEIDQPYDKSDAGLPAIEGNVTIEGNGAIIQRNQADDSVGFRLLTVESGAELHLRDLTVRYGWTGANGAGIGNNGTLTLTNTTVTENVTSGNGGGIFNGLGASLSVINSTIHDNLAFPGGGGGIYNRGSLEIVSSTLSENTGSSGGGGIYAHSTGTLELTSTILADNFSPGSHNIYGKVTTDGDYNLISDGDGMTGLDADKGNQVGTETDPVDPLLEPLASNGGPTQTLAIPLISPALDAIPVDESSCGDPINTDQRGEPRPIGGKCDIGAYENQSLVRGDDPIQLPADNVAELISLIEDANWDNAPPLTIDLTADLYELNSEYELSTGLPIILGNVTINGNKATIQRSESGTSLFRIFAVDDGAELHLHDVTVRNGAGNHHGGGILSMGGATLTLTNSTVAANTAHQSGGGIYVATDSSLVFSGGAVTGNTASNGSGGGIATRGPLTLTDSTVSGNTSASGLGGGIFSANAASLTSVILDNNHAKATGSVGGGIYHIGSQNLTLTRSTVSNSSAFEGGGIATFTSGASEISASTVRDNNALAFGGGISSGGGSVSLTDSTVSGNHVEDNGGGISSFSGSVNLANSTVSNNTADISAGGIFGDSSSLEITNSTITGNLAKATSFPRAGGIVSYGTITLSNTIVAGNFNQLESGNVPDDINNYYAGIVSESSLIGGGEYVIGLTDGDDGNQVGTVEDPIDPVLGPLANNGGLTETHLPLPGSPVIDAGGCLVDTDQRGEDRPQDAGCDIGSVEVQPHEHLDQPPSQPGTPELAEEFASPNQGVFDLIWTASDGNGVITYILERKPSDAGDEQFAQLDGGLTEPSHSFSTGDPEEEGRWVYRVQASIDDLASEYSEFSSEVVVDQTAPVLELPEDIMVDATGPEGASVEFTVSATDDVHGEVDVTCDPESGSTFPLDTTIVTCSATDSAENLARDTFTVEVVDRTAPELELPDDITADATGPDGAVVEFTVGATDDVDGAVAVSCDPESGTMFSIGKTDVTCTATDSAGNLTSDTFTVDVVDQTAPVLELPEDIMVDATGPDGASIEFTVSATDDVDGAVAVSCDPKSGSTFPIGPTIVTCSATDSAGNLASDTFIVEVVDPASSDDTPEEQLQDLITQVGDLDLQRGTSRALGSTLSAAQSAVERSNLNAACRQLNAATRQIQAQSGKRIDIDEADSLLSGLNEVRKTLGC